MNKLNHVAFIMDGNGRWGLKKNKGRRYYSISDIETINQIKSLLYEKHYSIKGAQKVILEMRKNTDIKNNADIELFSLIEDLKKVRSKIKKYKVKVRSKSVK